MSELNRLLFQIAGAFGALAVALFFAVICVALLLHIFAMIRQQFGAERPEIQSFLGGGDDDCGALG